MWDWLTGSLADRIIQIYQDLAVSMAEVSTLAQKTPKDFNPKLWKAVQQFNSKAVLPVGWAVLSLFLLLELANILKKTDAKGMDAIYWVSLVLIKILIAKMIMENMMEIIQMFFELSSFMLKRAGKTFTGTESFAVNASTKSAISDSVSKMNVISCLGVWVESELIGIAGMICAILSKLCVALRFIEIYVFTAIAAIPMATLVHDRYGDIGINYLKRMAALAIHVVFIIIVLFCYMVLVSDKTLFTSKNVLGALLGSLGYSILAVVALFQTGSWAKGLFGVH